MERNSDNCRRASKKTAYVGDASLEFLFETLAEGGLKPRDTAIDHAGESLGNG